MNILKRWKAYFEKLMNKKNAKFMRMVPTCEMEGIEQVSDEEVVNTLRKMKQGRAVGPANTSAEV